MGLFDRFRKQTEQIQTKEAPRVLFNKIQAYQGKNNRKFVDYAREGYQENAIVYKSVSMISNNASAVKIKVFSGDNELDSHPLISLLERPNPLQSGVEFFQSLISYLLISGNSYIIKDKENLPLKSSLIFILKIQLLPNSPLKAMSVTHLLYRYKKGLSKPNRTFSASISS